MSFQDIHNSNINRHSESSSAVPFLRMRRNHPPKLPRVHAIPFTPPAPTTKQSRSNERGRSLERTTNNGSRSSSIKGVLADDLIDSYEMKLSNSHSSNSEASVLDPCIESRDDYESFGPDRDQQNSSTSISSSKRQHRKLAKQLQRKINNSSNNHIRNVKSTTSVSTFAKLTYEMQQYQKLVSDLEYMIRDTIVTPEVAWKTNILVKSVEDTDSGINDQLVQYEQSIALQERLLTYNNNIRVYQKEKKRTTQQLAACNKLRRDYTRCHNTMQSSLKMYKMRQKAEISQLGAVQWNTIDRSGCNDAGIASSVLSQQQQAAQMEEDFFDRVMRQKELERMNESMRKVNDIYHSLAGLVNGQQDNIDEIENDANYSKANIKNGYDEFSCYADRQNGFNAICGDMSDWGQTEDNNNDDTNAFIGHTTLNSKNRETTSASVQKLRINENFYWSMPFETMKEDLQSVQEDFAGIGKNFMNNCKRLDCCNDE